MSAASSTALPPLHADGHAKFVHSLDSRKESFHFWTSQHLRVSGIYWGCGAMSVLGRLHEMNREEIVPFALSCQNADGGFGGNAGQDSHMLYTLSAVQVLCMFDAIDKCNIDGVATWVAARQQPDGSFAGDPWGEIDTRFSYCALNCLSLLGQEHLARVDIQKAMDFVLSCENWDGGFGVVPQAESHAGQIFCAVGALCIGNALHRIDQDRLGYWLAERQLPTGGLNGRPEKKADVCYSWWVVSSLAMLGRLHWVSGPDLFRYILGCQDAEDGGIADKPENMPDVYHTFFGLTGLSLLGYTGAPLQLINPVYAMPYDVLEKRGVPLERGAKVGWREVPKPE